MLNLSLQVVLKNAVEALHLLFWRGVAVEQTEEPELLEVVGWFLRRAFFFGEEPAVEDVIKCAIDFVQLGKPCGIVFESAFELR